MQGLCREEVSIRQSYYYIAEVGSVFVTCQEIFTICFVCSMYAIFLIVMPNRFLFVQLSFNITKLSKQRKKKKYGSQKLVTYPIHTSKPSYFLKPKIIFHVLAQNHRPSLKWLLQHISSVKDNMKNCTTCRVTNSPSVHLKYWGRCLAVMYCCITCQLHDWERHRKVECQPRRFCRCCGKLKSYVHNLSTCGRCLRTKYCLANCQREDWKRHKAAECSKAHHY